MTAVRILLVEDNPDDVLFLRRAFDKAGLSAELFVAEDGQRAVDRLSDGSPPPTHLLLDLKLPKRSGLEVLAWIRSQDRWRSLPVIVLTSSEVKSDADRTRELGIDDFLVKPLRAKDLDVTVSEIAARWRLAPRAPVAGRT